MASFHKQSPNPAKKNGGQLHVTDLENDVLNYNYRTLLEDLEILHAKGAKDETMKRLSIMLSMLEEDTTRTPDINRAYRRMDFFFETYWEPCNMVNSQVRIYLVTTYHILPNFTMLRGGMVKYKFILNT